MGEKKNKYQKKDKKPKTEGADGKDEANPDVVSIQMRNYCEKKGKEKVWKFKGSIFLTFKTEDAAKAFVAKEEKYKEEIKGMTIVGSLLEGEEEDKFLKDSAQDLKNRRNKNRGQKRRGGGHHGHGGKRGRR